MWINHCTPETIAIAASAPTAAQYYSVCNNSSSVRYIKYNIIIKFGYALNIIIRISYSFLGDIILKIPFLAFSAHTYCTRF